MKVVNISTMRCRNLTQTRSMSWIFSINICNNLPTNATLNNTFICTVLNIKNYRFYTSDSSIKKSLVTLSWLRFQVRENVKEAKKKTIKTYFWKNKESTKLSTLQTDETLYRNYILHSHTLNRTVNNRKIADKDKILSQNCPNQLIVNKSL